MSHPNSISLPIGNDRPKISETAGKDGESTPKASSNLGVKNRLRPYLKWESGLAVALVIALVVSANLSPLFFTSGNIFDLGLSVGEIAIMALPMTLIVITGEIDLSVASILGLSSSLLGYLWEHHWPMYLIIVTLLVVGGLLGAVNGLLITRLGLPSLAVTIGTLTLYRGIALIVLGSNIVANFPNGYTKIGVVPLPHIDMAWSIAIFLVLAVIFGLVLHFSSVGRSIYAIGRNTEAALFAGIRVKRYKTMLYILSGVICAGAGILFTFKLATSEYDNGTGLELNVVSIVLLAGVSIFGGKGRIIGVVLAVALFGTIQNSLLLTTFPQQAMGIVTGGLLLISVFGPNYSEYKTRFIARLRLRQRN